MSYLDGDELLTKQEVIEEIMDRVQNQLWSSKDESIMEFATTVGVNITATTNGLTPAIAITTVSSIIP